MSSNKPIAQRFWEKVAKTDSCWEWQSIINAYGYGVFCNGPHGTKRRFMAHRVAYELEYGAYDQTLYVCHKCDNRKCVRPDHLFLGTQTDNMKDCAKKGRVMNQGFLSFAIISPSGERIEGTNLTKFCRDNQLGRPAMFEVVRGERESHKGYTKAP